VRNAGRLRYFEDLSEGEEYVSGPQTVDADECLEFARRYDPQYFHTDVVTARRSIFGGVVASGIYTMALWRQLDHSAAPDIAWVCGVAWDDVRFPVAVRPGDTLRAHAKCLGKRLSKSRPDRGIVVLEYLLRNQRNEIVFSCRSTNLIERNPAPPKPGQGEDGRDLGS
jgi:acyl dehydratase